MKAKAKAKAKASALLVVSLLLAGPRHAVAQPSAGVDAARRHADAGQAALQASDFQRAFDEYTEAYRLFPNALLLVNVARAESGLGRNADAIRTLGRVLADSSVDAARRREVETEVQRLRGMVVELTIAVTPSGSQIRVGGQLVGESPLAEPVLVDRPTGNRNIEVEASHAGYETAHWTHTFEPGARPPVSLALERIGPDDGHVVDDGTGDQDQDEVVLPPSGGERPARSNTLLWVTGIGGGVLGAASLGMGAYLASASGNCDKKTSDGDCIRDDADGLNALGVVADILGGVAIVGGVVFFYVLATSGDAEEAAATALAEPGVLHF